MLVGRMIRLEEVLAVTDLVGGSTPAAATKASATLT